MTTSLLLMHQVKRWTFFSCISADRLAPSKSSEYITFFYHFCKNENQGAWQNSLNYNLINLLRIKQPKKKEAQFTLINSYFNTFCILLLAHLCCTIVPHWITKGKTKQNSWVWCFWWVKSYRYYVYNQKDKTGGK